MREIIQSSITERMKRHWLAILVPGMSPFWAMRRSERLAIFR